MLYSQRRRTHCRPLGLALLMSSKSHRISVSIPFPGQLGRLFGQLLGYFVPRERGSAAGRVGRRLGQNEGGDAPRIRQRLRRSQLQTVLIQNEGETGASNVCRLLYKVPRLNLYQIYSLFFSFTLCLGAYLFLFKLVSVSLTLSLVSLTLSLVSLTVSLCLSLTVCVCLRLCLVCMSVSLFS